LTDTPEQMSRKIGLSEWFSGFACLVSACTIIFSVGVVYGETRENTRRLGILEGKVDTAIPDIAGMKADIKYLVDAERRRQERDHRRDE